MSEEGNKKMSVSKVRTKQYTIRFPPEATDALKEMAEVEGVTMAEIIRRAINFYQVKIEAKKNDKKIVLESREGKKEWVMV